MLSYRPDLAAGGLVKSETQAWCKDMKEGSHRLKGHWLDPRYKWLQISVEFPSGGRPKPADWRCMKHAKRLQDMEEQHEWIKEDRKFFGQPNTHYDFKATDPKEAGQRIQKLEATKDKLSKNVNMRAMNMLGKAEEQCTDLVKKKKIVEEDKKKITLLIPNQLLIQFDAKLEPRQKLLTL